MHFHTTGTQGIWAGILAIIKSGDSSCWISDTKQLDWVESHQILFSITRISILYLFGALFPPRSLVFFRDTGTGSSDIPVATMSRSGLYGIHGLNHWFSSFPKFGKINLIFFASVNIVCSHRF